MKIFGSQIGSPIIPVTGLVFALSFPAVGARAGGRDFGQGGGPINSGCDYAACNVVERTVYIPTMVKERRVVNVTECQSEQRQRTVTVSKCVPDTRAVREVYTVMVPEVRKRTEVYHVCTPVWREVERNVTVQVPVHEQRQGTRQVCRQVQVQEMRNVTRDHGHWEEVICDDDCGMHSGCTSSCFRPIRRWGRGCGSCNACRGCDPCGADWSCGYDAGCGKAIAAHTHQVWRPNPVNEQVPVTVWRNEMVAEPYEYTVTTWHPEKRVQVMRICETVNEERSHEVEFTVCVPQQHERVRNVTTYKTVAEPRVENYTVLVPHTVQREVEVTVCRMVPQQVMCPVPACGAACGGRCGPRHVCGW